MNKKSEKKKSDGEKAGRKSSGISMPVSETSSCGLGADYKEREASDGESGKSCESKINKARGSDGRFIKGNVPPKSTGRPCKSKELAALLKPSYSEIKRILASDASDKVKFEAAKWVIEMNIGKPTQQLDAKAQIDNAGVVEIKFEGELNEWSE